MFVVISLLLLLLLLLLLTLPSAAATATSTATTSITDDVILLACERGEVYRALQMVASFDESTKNLNVNLLHIQSQLTFILESDVTNAIILHKQAKAVDPKTPPILAMLQQAHRRDCGGAGDIFYVAAVILKQFVGTNASNPDVLYNGHTTLVTLLADSGFHDAAEKHMRVLVSLQPSDKSLAIRNSLMTPAIFRDTAGVLSTRAILEKRMHDISGVDSKINILDEFVLSPYYYYCYQGYNDKKVLSALQAAYASGFPMMSGNLLHSDLLNPPLVKKDDAEVSVEGDTIQQSTRKTRVGFVSSHFRKHSICKLFCGIISKLAEDSQKRLNSLEIFVFSSLEKGQEDDFTKRLGDSLESDHYVSVPNTLLKDRSEVSSRSIDVLVYLDIGMDPKTIVWASARLAPVQVATWGHPSTTGIETMDFYISSDGFHSNRVNPALIAHDNSIYTLSNSIDPYPAYFDIALGAKIVKSDNQNAADRQEKCCSNLRPTVTTLLTTFHSIEYINNDCYHKDQDFHANSCLLDSKSGEIKSNSGRKGLSVLEQELFSEQLIRLDSLGLYFDRNIPTQITKYVSNTILKKNLDSEEIRSKQFFSEGFEFNSGKGSSIFNYPSAAASYMMSIRPKNTYYSSLIDLLPLETKPMVKDLLALIATKSFATLLLPQHLSKIHPIFDVALKDILQAVPNSKIAILQPTDKLQWKLTLEKRWIALLGVDMARERIIWVPPLNSNEYLTLLALGDVMLDPFPFGGGVTTLEALAVCTPVVTAPSLQSVPALATGMLSLVFDDDNMNKGDKGDKFVDNGILRRLAIADTIRDYVGSVERLLSPSSYDNQGSSNQHHHDDIITQMRIHICKSSHLVFNQSLSVEDWSTVLANLVG